MFVRALRGIDILRVTPRCRITVSNSHIRS